MEFNFEKKTETSTLNIKEFITSFIENIRIYAKICIICFIILFFMNLYYNSLEIIEHSKGFPNEYANMFAISDNWTTYIFWIFLTITVYSVLRNIYLYGLLAFMRDLIYIFKYLIDAIKTTGNNWVSLFMLSIALGLLSTSNINNNKILWVLFFFLLFSFSANYKSRIYYFTVFTLYYFRKLFNVNKTRIKFNGGQISLVLFGFTIGVLISIFQINKPVSSIILCILFTLFTFLFTRLKIGNILTIIFFLFIFAIFIMMQISSSMPAAYGNSFFENIKLVVTFLICGNGFYSITKSFLSSFLSTSILFIILIATPHFRTKFRRIFPPLDKNVLKKPFIVEVVNFLYPEKKDESFLYTLIIQGNGDINNSPIYDLDKREFISSQNEYEKSETYSESNSQESNQSEQTASSNNSNNDSEKSFESNSNSEKTYETSSDSSQSATGAPV